MEKAGLVRKLWLALFIYLNNTLATIAQAMDRVFSRDVLSLTLLKQ